MSQTPPKRRSLLTELTVLATILGISDLTVSGIIVAIVGFFDPNPLPGFGVILAVFITTLPLTVAIAIIVVRHGSGVFDLAGASVTIIVAALISDLLNLQTHVTLLQSSNIPSGPSSVVNIAVGLLGIYWSRYGPLLFLKSIVLGGYLGAKLKALRS